jgi:anaerobic selenocysteine-containing dehydrogenase
MAVKEVKTFCRICISSCGLIADVDGDTVVRVRGDSDHPLTDGYTCQKGRSLPHMHHHPLRLERPQMRVNGVRTDSTWDLVLGDLSTKLSQIIEESGPRAVGIFLGGGGYMDGAGYLAVRNLARALNTPSSYSDLTIDAISKIWVSEMICGIAGQSPRPDYDNCRMVIFIGTNPMVSHGHSHMLNVPTKRLRELRTEGEIWVIDPRRTETAVRATHHLRPRPGTDYAMLAFLVREVLRQGADHAYLANHARGVEQLAAAVEPYAVDKVSAISGLSHRDLEEMLGAVRRAGRIAVETGTGVAMSREANLVTWLSWALMIITNSFDHEGGAYMNPGLLMQLDRIDIPPAPPGGTRGPGPSSRPELPSISGEYPCASLPDEIEAGHLRALINVAGNIVACLPETERTTAALKKLEVLASVDIIGNASTDMSTHVLPSKDQLERADFTYLTDTALPYLSAQYTHPVVAPVGERRSYWWILSQLCKRMGLQLLPGVDPDIATDEDVLATMTRGSRVSFDQLRDGEFFIWDDKKRPIGWLRRYVDEKLGGWRLAPQELVEQLGETKPSTAPLVLISHRQKTHMNARLIDLAKKWILLNAEEAARAGLKDGDQAIVRSDYGVVEGTVQLDENLPNGVLNVPHGWDDAFNANRLTSSKDVDLLTGMPWFSGFPVSIQAAWQINAPRGTQNVVHGG